MKKTVCSNFLAVMILLSLFMPMASCSSMVDAIFGVEDNPSPTPQQDTTAKNVEYNSKGAKVTPSSVAEATTLLATLVDDIKTKGVGEGKEYVIEVAGDAVQSGSDITLTVPKVVGANINLAFDKPFSEGTTLNINASETSGNSTQSVNTLTLTLPSTTDGLVLNVNMPETTVILKSATGATTTYREVISRTATNTLIVDEDVTVNNVDVQGGTVQINEGGLLDSWTFAAETNGDQVYVKEDGGIEPVMTGDGQWLIFLESRPKAQNVA